MPDSPSPRIPDSVLARCPGSAQAPGEHSPAELARILQLLVAVGADSITVGHGRDRASSGAAWALVDAWTAAGGAVVDRVDWPSSAASWRRTARRLVAGRPDAWVIADSPAGWAQVARRLAAEPAWSPARTIGFAGLAGADLVTLAGDRTLLGMTGASSTGGVWRIGQGLLILTDDPDRPPADNSLADRATNEACPSFRPPDSEPVRSTSTPTSLRCTRCTPTRSS